MSENELREVLEIAAREAHGLGYANSRHVEFIPGGIHDEGQYKTIRFEECPDPFCMRVNYLLTQNETVLDGSLRQDAVQKSHPNQRWVYRNHATYALRLAVSVLREVQFGAVYGESRNPTIPAAVFARVGKVLADILPIVEPIEIKE